MPAFSSQPQAVIVLVIVAYVAIITSAGAYYSKIRTADAYFRAGGAIPWWTAGVSMYMGNFTAYSFVALASLVYIDGTAGSDWTAAPCWPFSWGPPVFAVPLASVAPHISAGIPGNAVVPSTRKLFSSLGIFTTFLSSGMRLYAMSKLVETFLGFPLVWSIVLVAVIVVYTMLGGLWGVVITEVLQFVILYLAVVSLAVMCVAWGCPARLVGRGLGAGGPGISWLGRISEPGARPHLGLVAGVLGRRPVGLQRRMGADPEDVLHAHGVRRPQGRSAGGPALSIPHAFLLLGPCFIARVFWQAEIADPHVIGQAEAVYGKIAMKLLPAGMIGIVLAAMISSTLSTLSAAWNARATSLVNDLYVRFLRSPAADREQIAVGRLAVVGIGVLGASVGVAIALTSSGIFSLAQSLIGLIVIPLVLPLLLGLLIPVANPWAGIIGFAAAAGVACVNRWGFCAGLLCVAVVRTRSVFVETIVATGAILASGLLARDCALRLDQTRAFFARLRQSRPALPADTAVPPPTRTIGTFLILIGLLMAALCFLSATCMDLVVMGSATTVLMGIGLTMRYRRTRSGSR